MFYKRTHFVLNAHDFSLADRVTSQLKVARRFSCTLSIVTDHSNWAFDLIKLKRHTHIGVQIGVVGQNQIALVQYQGHF
jgi:hypothetical protein